MARLVALIALLLLALPAAAQERKEVDLALVLAIDISGSIDPDEAKLQRQGYVEAFTDPVIIKAILGGNHGRIAVAKSFRCRAHHSRRRSKRSMPPIAAHISTKPGSPASA